jgi:hypothetical protein
MVSELMGTSVMGASRCLTSLTAFTRNSTDNPLGSGRRASGGTDPIPPVEGVLGRRWGFRGSRGRVQGRSTSSRRFTESAICLEIIGIRTDHDVMASERFLDDSRVDYIGAADPSGQNPDGAALVVVRRFDLSADERPGHEGLA